MSEMPMYLSSLLMIGIAVIIVLAAFIPAFYFYTQDKKVIKSLEDKVGALDARLSELERKNSVRDGRSASLPREQTRDRSQPTLLPKYPEMGINDEPKSSTNLVRPVLPPTFGVVSLSHPEARSETAPSLIEVAAKALDSAESCNRFAEAYKAIGFGIDSDGRTSSEQTLPPDRGEILVLQHHGRHFVVPSFNMKRNQGLYTSDAGRAAEARLGKFFEIERGEKLLALEAAEVSKTWEVIKKGRLVLPLEKN